MAVASPILSGIMQGLGATNGFVADKILPRVTPTEVRALSGGDMAFTYYKVGDRVFRNNEGQNLIVSDGSAPSRSRITIDDATGTAKMRMHDVPLNQERRKAMPSTLGYERNLVLPKLKNTIDLGIEIDTFAMLSASGNFTNATTGSAGTATYWDDPQTQIPQQFGLAALSVLKASGLCPTDFVVAADAFNKLIQNPSIRVLFGDEATSITRVMLEEMFRAIVGNYDNEGSKRFRLHVAAATYDSANIGATSSPAFVYTNAAFLGAFAPTDQASLEYPSAAYSFELQPYTVETYIDDTHNDFVWRGKKISQPTAVTNAAGHRFVTPCASVTA